MWGDSAFVTDPRTLAFKQQLERVVATPKIPEWEQIANRVWVAAEQAVRGSHTAAQALAALDEDVDRMLVKRKWMLEKGLLEKGPLGKAAAEVSLSGSAVAPAPVVAGAQMVIAESPGPGVRVESLREMVDLSTNSPLANSLQWPIGAPHKVDKSTISPSNCAAAAPVSTAGPRP